MLLLKSSKLYVPSQGQGVNLYFQRYFKGCCSGVKGSGREAKLFKPERFQLRDGSRFTFYKLGSANLIETSIVQIFSSMRKWKQKLWAKMKAKSISSASPPDRRKWKQKHCGENGSKNIAAKMKAKTLRRKWKQTHFKCFDFTIQKNIDFRDLQMCSFGPSASGATPHWKWTYWYVKVPFGNIPMRVRKFYKEP